MPITLASTRRAVAAVVLVSASAFALPAAAPATTVTPLPWSLGQPSASGTTTVVGVLPTDHRIGLSTAGAPAAPVDHLDPVVKGAAPHLGTDASGHRLLVYPRCRGARLASGCDLYEARLDGTGERKVPGVNTAAGNELVGVMDRGDVAFLRSAKGVGDPGLYLRRRGGRAVRVTAAGGTELALRGRWIAQVRDADPTVGACGLPTVELRSFGGKVRTVQTRRCGLSGQSLTGVGFVGGLLEFLSYDAVGSGATTVFRTAPAARTLSRADGPRYARGFAATGLATGIATLADASDPSSGRTTLGAVRGLSFR
jgi:hypothetical protein